MKLGLAHMPSSDARAAAVMPALRNAAARVGVDFDALFRTAKVESSFNPEARAGTSSATGLFQFIDSTWLSTLARHGARHGINAATRNEALALRRDPHVASLMAAEHMAENKAFLEERFGRPMGTTELYLAHFLGVGGAQRFLGKMAADPAASAADLMPRAADANRAIFYDRAGGARSLADVHALLSRRLGVGSEPGGIRGPEIQLAGTVVPADGRDSGTTVPPGLPPTIAVQMLLMMDGALPASDNATTASAASAPVDPRLAAQAAYLILAELGA